MKCHEMTPSVKSQDTNTYIYIYIYIHLCNLRIYLYNLACKYLNNMKKVGMLRGSDVTVVNLVVTLAPKIVIILPDEGACVTETCSRITINMSNE
jgi:hypothetical protein